MLAAIFLLTAVMPGLLAAAQGVQIQGHICSPDGAGSAPVGEQPFLPRTNTVSYARQALSKCRFSSEQPTTGTPIQHCKARHSSLTMLHIVSGELN